MPPFAPPPGFMPPPGAFPPFAGSPAMAAPVAVGTPPFQSGPAGLPSRPQFLPPNPALTAGPPPSAAGAPPPPTSAPISATVLPPKDGVMWPDAEASPVSLSHSQCTPFVKLMPLPVSAFSQAEKRALQPKYRYTSPTPQKLPSAGLPPRPAAMSQDGGSTPDAPGISSRKRKAATDFLD